jgi:predicted DNA-binding transcriptional regulator YafY
MTKNIRLLSILEQLSKHHKVCVKELALFYAVSVKSIQSDLKIVSEYFSENLVKKADCYYLLSQDSFSNLFSKNPQTIKHFLHLLSTIDSSLYEDFISENRELLEGLNFTTSTIYQIENSPYEHLTKENKIILDKIESFITQKKYITIVYERPQLETFTYLHSIPIKILYLKENWYLAVLTTNDVDNNSVYKLLRVSFIAKLRESNLEPKFFHDDNIEKLKTEQFLKTIQSPFSNMQISTYTVTIKVSATVARYFQAKKYLKSQKIKEQLKNGDILVSYEISNDMEIIPLVQQWMPLVHVVEPLRIEEKIELNIKNFMKGK